MDASIAGVKPRETAGSAAYRAFDFQIHFSLLKVLTLHKEGQDFTALFDHHDDLVLITGPDADASFYQVKSKADAAWTTKQLAKRGSRGDLPRSILGKAYYNIDQFGPDILRAAIVSNQPLSAKYADGKKVKSDDGEFTFGALSQDDCDAVADALAADFPNGVDPIHAERLTYERTPLDLQSYRKTVLGEVTEFAERIDPTRETAPKPIYDALLSEIGRCTGDVSRPTSLQTLLSRKSLARADLESLAQRVANHRRSPLEWWDVVASELSSVGVGAIAQHRLRLGCLAYWNDRRRGSRAAGALSEALSLHIDANPHLVTDSVRPTTEALAATTQLSAPVGATYGLDAALTVEVMERTL